MKKGFIILLFVMLASVSGYAQKQVKVKLTTGMEIKGKMKSFDPLSAMVIEIAGAETTIPAEKIANIEEVNVSDTPVATQGSQEDYKPTATDSNDFPDIDLTDFHGSLTHAGNCVYVPTDSPADYERAGQEIIKHFLQKNGVWKVVDTPDQAHFVLQYVVDLRGRDYAQLYLRTRNSYKYYPEITSNRISGKIYQTGTMRYGMYCNTSEDVKDNIKAAQTMANQFGGGVIYASDISELNKKQIKELTQNGFIIP